MRQRAEIWGAAEIAQAFNVSDATVTRWTSQPDFPAPTVLAMGRVWEAGEVRDWRRKQQAQRRNRRAF